MKSHYWKSMGFFLFGHACHRCKVPIGELSLWKSVLFNVFGHLFFTWTDRNICKDRHFKVTKSQLRSCKVPIEKSQSPNCKVAKSQSQVQSNNSICYCDTPDVFRFEKTFLRQELNLFHETWFPWDFWCPWNFI